MNKSFSKLRKVKLGSLLFGILFCISVNAANLEIQIIPQPEVKNYITSLFRSSQVRKYVEQGGNIISDVIDKISKYPLFVYIPLDHPAARLNFTAYFRALSLRHTSYSDPVMADLYLLHEIAHIATMPYGKYDDFKGWQEKMLRNEKEVTVFNESLVHLLFPEIRQAFSLPNIWVDRFIAKRPDITRDELVAEMYRISKSPYSTLDPVEQRSWIYDRANEVWTHVYWPIASEVEAHMLAFYQTAEMDPAKASAEHLKWLNAHTDEGLMFPEPAKEFYGLNVYLNTVSQYASLGSFAEFSEAAAVELAKNVKLGVTDNNIGIPTAEELLRLGGVSATVFSLPYPELYETYREVLQGIEPEEMLGQAYTRQQDGEHVGLIENYKQWAAPVVTGLNQFPIAYNANGSSEALKDTLSFIKAQNPDAVVHMFEGEYEGILYIADPLKLKVVRHPRTPETLKKLKELCKPGDYFYITQPSSLDGNIWDGYDEFMKLSQEAGLKVLVDLAYVGVVAKNYSIKVDYQHIESVFFSLSKAFGTYYLRIGGVFTKTPNGLLYGNKWFKNVPMLRLGAALLKKYGVHYLPRKYAWAQTASVLELVRRTGLPVEASDVVLLANLPIQKNATPPIMKELYRGNANEGFLRFCLTGTMYPTIHSVEKNRIEAECAKALAVTPKE